MGQPRGDHWYDLVPGGSQLLGARGIVVTCACVVGLDCPLTQLHSAPTACALIAAEDARGRQGEGVKGVTICGIADTDHRAVAKAFRDAGVGTWVRDKG